MTARRRLALVVEYEGTRYHGFQRQANAPSVQGELETALYQLTGERLRVHGASRTDAGAHALAQVVAFTTASAHTPDTVMQALNFHLPEDIRVRAAVEVALGFSPRRRATGRWYRYSIVDRPAPSALLRRYVHWVSRRLDVDAMRAGAAALVGIHDFAALAGAVPPGRTTVRHVTRLEVRRWGDLVRMDVEGNAFLPQQVRKMAGLLAQVGLGKLPADAVGQALAGAPWIRRVPVLPARGLCLMAVRYGEPPLAALVEAMTGQCIMADSVFSTFDEFGPAPEQGAHDEGAQDLVS